MTSVAAIAASAAIGCGDGDDGGDGDGDGDGDTATFDVRIENVAATFPILKSGEIEAPITPSGTATDTFTATFTAPPGTRLSFATMFVPSNDFFYAPDDQGIALWTSEGARVTGDVTAQVMVWDAGTEINQELGLGADQVQNQDAEGQGAADVDQNVRLAVDANLPAVTDVISVELAAGATDTEFVLTISNVSDDTTLMVGGNTRAVALSPGLWVVHGGSSPLFTIGSPDRGEGLEAIAEDGNRTSLAAAQVAQRGLNVPISPGVFAVHSVDGVLFSDGVADSGLGLEAIAEDGMPGALAAALEANSGVSESGAFDTPEGASAPGGLVPGASPAAAYTFQVTARPGDRLSFAAMFVASNDLFFAPGDSGVPLFSGQAPVSGDVTAQIDLWDVGSEVNQEPGVGLDQVQRQSGPDSGASEGGVVQTVAAASDGFTYPSVDSVIRVTITPRP